MFTWGQYLKEEKDTEIINPSEIDIKAVYKVLKNIKGIKRIDINQYPSYGPMESDMRKKICVSLDIEKKGSIKEVLGDITEELSGYDIEIESIQDRDEDEDEDKKTPYYYALKCVRFKLFKKYGADKLIKAMAAPLPVPGSDYDSDAPVLTVVRSTR